MCIPNLKKRSFISLASKVIDNKLSIGYFLELSTNFEILKKKLLDQEEFQNFNKLPFLSLEEQLKEFNIEI